MEGDHVWEDQTFSVDNNRVCHPQTIMFTSGMTTSHVQSTESRMHHPISVAPLNNMKPIKSKTSTEQVPKVCLVYNLASSRSIVCSLTQTPNRVHTVTKHSSQPQILGFSGLSDSTSSSSFIILYQHSPPPLSFSSSCHVRIDLQPHRCRPQFRKTSVAGWSTSC